MKNYRRGIQRNLIPVRIFLRMATALSRAERSSNRWVHRALLLKACVWLTIFILLLVATLRLLAVLQR